LTKLLPKVWWLPFFWNTVYILLDCVINCLAVQWSVWCNASNNL